MGKKAHGFIVQIIPDRDYLLKKYTTKEKLAFSGQIKIKSKTGKQRNTCLFKVGKTSQFIKSVSSTFRTMTEDEEDEMDVWMLEEIVVIGYSYDDFNQFYYLFLTG